MPDIAREVKGRRCARCGRQYRMQPNWTVKHDDDVVVEMVCPDCMTPMEHVEAALKASGFNVTRPPEQPIDDDDEEDLE